jgi:hypothetical protein
MPPETLRRTSSPSSRSSLDSRPDPVSIVLREDRLTRSSSPTPTFACVSESAPEWFERTFSLVLSIRRLSGSLAGAPVVVYFLDDPNARFASSLEGLGATVRVVARVDPDYPYANKLRIFEAGAEPGTDLLVALDCDTVVVGDFAALLPTKAVGVKPADRDFLRDEDWQCIFRELGIQVPARDCFTTSLNQRTYPYFNSGVVTVPSAMCRRLYDLWAEYTDAVASVRRRHPEIRRLRLYAEQVSLACALQAGELPVRRLPTSMNFPAHLDVHRDHLPSGLPPKIVHHHGRTDGHGFLLATRYEGANDLIDRFNEERSEAIGIPYPGLRRPALGDRIKQTLRMTSWYHSNPVMLARGAVGRRASP